MSEGKISLRKAGEILGISHERVRQLRDNGEIKCDEGAPLTMEILNEFIINRKDSLVGKKKSDKRYKVKVESVK